MTTISNAGTEEHEETPIKNAGLLQSTYVMPLRGVLFLSSNSDACYYVFIQFFQSVSKKLILHYLKLPHEKAYLSTHLPFVKKKSWTLCEPGLWSVKLAYEIVQAGETLWKANYIVCYLDGSLPSPCCSADGQHAHVRETNHNHNLLLCWRKGITISLHSCETDHNHNLWPGELLWWAVLLPGWSAWIVAWALRFTGQCSIGWGVN